MNNELSLFDNSEDEKSPVMQDVRTTMENETHLLQSRVQAMQDLSDKLEEEVQDPVEEKVEAEKQSQDTKVFEPTFYTKEEIFPEVVKYFGGDELAAGVWIDKYALKNRNGKLMERTPEDMHRRMAREFARIEKKYIHPMSEEQIFQLFDHFKYIIPQGSTAQFCESES